ncbi:MAG: hypothetical protein COA96_06455 [SAR86 cluster bacterium]|uniref:Universal stress protein n=1 Tax=SAR86 cluster bacterium TaxID=2030880 RepID=A0A2A5B2T7_9GAMM|nr:MAG: hypothetical protein COA96_06455 [SAR86 cluster bacterium]
MAQFRKLLLALDLNSESELLIGRVLQMCRDELDRLHVVHVIEEGMHNAMPTDLEAVCNPHVQRMFDHTAIRLREVLTRNGLKISSDKIFLVHGEPSFEIKKLAREINADLVIVGSHSKHGDIMHLPGSTTNCVMQGISSDVIAVKI